LAADPDQSVRRGLIENAKVLRDVLVMIAAGSDRVAVEAQRKLCQFRKTRDEKSDKEAD
jgi:hypothetical protein